MQKGIDMINTLLKHCNQLLDNERREALLSILGNEMFCKKVPVKIIPIEKVYDHCSNTMDKDLDE